ncbi:hypothetical protein RhiirA4_462819 [Rhizophagus irregularis]|uniref:Uncharacterized protein n=1 Tax=Rhizophagus irregularis TaxID=588596 RepID=A0A2I1GLT7_9GLOM|nr:hypothetical protein RhiirA4_462819 [Rhizophagus irregularis]
MVIFEELDRLQVNEDAEETIQNEVYNTEENIQNQSSKSDESSDDESDSNKNFESFQSNDNDFSSTWFFDFQNTNSLALQEWEFHTSCHTVLNHLNSLKEIANFLIILIQKMLFKIMKLVNNLN